MLTQQTYCLNLSDRYVPNWGAWQVAREIICNAIDADRDGMVIETPDRNTLRVSTTTSPTLSDIFVIGGGSKNEGGETIGQFGEGMKMAALVAARDGQGMTIKIPGHVIRFEFVEVMGSRVLHGRIENDHSLKSGSVVKITMPQIGNAHAGKILLDEPEGPFLKQEDSEGQVFCKGIYVGAVPADYQWSWNLKNLTINRDRSMVDSGSLLESAGRWLAANMDSAMAKALIENHEAKEANAWLWAYATERTKKLILEAFRGTFGPEFVLTSGDLKTDLKASSNGARIAQIGGYIHEILKQEGVEVASAKVFDFDFEAVPTAPYIQQIKELDRLASCVNGPGYKLCVFSNRTVETMGFADFDERTIWIREDLFSEGNESRLRATFLHELAHLSSSAPDESIKFEFALTTFLGILAAKGVGI